MSPLLNEILKLSLPERVLLVEAIWDSIADEQNGAKDYQLTEEQILLLEEELVAYSKNPKEGSGWAEIKRRIRRRK